MTQIQIQIYITPITNITYLYLHEQCLVDILYFVVYLVCFLYISNISVIYDRNINFVVFFYLSIKYTLILTHIILKINSNSNLKKTNHQYYLFTSLRTTPVAKNYLRCIFSMFFLVCSFLNIFIFYTYS